VKRVTLKRVQMYLYMPHKIEFQKLVVLIIPFTITVR